MSKIEWTQRTWNPIVGCTKVSEGCKNCYAIRMAHRLSHNPATADKYQGSTIKTEAGQLNWTGKLLLNEEALTLPLRTKKPTMWFVNSMSDLFHEDIDEAWVYQVLDVIKLTPQHTYQVLTKRPHRMKYLMEEWYRLQLEHHGVYFYYLPNLWLGMSVENQRWANERLPMFNVITAAVKFVSAEPLLGPINFEEALGDTMKWHYGGLKNCISWVIAGGESGPGARPMHPNWVRSLRDQCVEDGVPFFFKQWGEYGPVQYYSNEKPVVMLGTDKQNHLWADPKAKTLQNMKRMGKKAAGRVLDGIEWSQMPAV